MEDQERKRRIVAFLFESPDIPQELRTKIERWLLDHENDRTVEGILHRFWDTCPTPVSQEQTRLGLARLHDTLRIRRRPYRTLLRRTAIAAALALLFGAGWLTAARFGRPAAEVILLSGKDNASEFTLPDGSRVWLNGESRLSYPADFSGRSREVKLSGEAYFEVHRDTLRPFRVDMNRMQIEVLGTSFDAIAYNSGACDQVILRSGSVRVTNPSLRRPVVLRPDERLTFDRTSGTSRIDRVDADNYCRWFERSLVFDNTPLQEILIHLERRYRMRIDFPPTIPLDTRLSITVHREPLEHIMDVLATLLPIGYRIGDGHVTITRRNP